VSEHSTEVAIRAYAAGVTAVNIRARGVRWESTEFPGWLEVSVNDSSGHRHTIVDKVPVLTTADVAPTEDFPIELWISAAFVRMEGINVVVQLAHGVATREGLETLTVAPEDARWP
jgi:hypothetical protein